MKNRKLKNIVNELNDGSLIDEILKPDQIALLGRLDYEEMLEALDNNDDAQTLYFKVAQYLAGEQKNGEYPSYYALMEHSTSYKNENWVTPAQWAADWNEWVTKQQEEELA
jgi:hypothetical protein